MGDPVETVVGQRVRRRRRLLGMTQQELSVACGVSFQQVQKYECACSRMSVAMLWRLACALGVDVSYFFADMPEAVEARRAPPRHPDRRTSAN